MLSTMNGLSASIVTTHGDIVVPKLLPRNGPSGTYSHFWISRAADNNYNYYNYNNYKNGPSGTYSHFCKSRASHNNYNYYYNYNLYNNNNYYYYNYYNLYNNNNNNNFYLQRKQMFMKLFFLIELY